MSVGANIKRLREAQGLTQEQLAEKIGVSAPMICQIERGTKAPSLPLSVEIAAQLGCDIREIADA